MSTTAGTPVKSCRITLLGLNGISSGFILGVQDAILITSSLVTRKPSHFLSADSSNIRIENGSSSNLHNPCSSSLFNDIKKPVSPECVANPDFAENKSPATMFIPAVIKHKNMPKNKLRIYLKIKR